MTIFRLKQYPDPILRKVSEPVGDITDETRELVDAMETTLYAHKAAGLSAIQIGISLRITVIDPNIDGAPMTEPTLVLIDPEILSTHGDPVRIEEGCLSFPKIWINVDRPPVVKLRARNRHGTPFDMTAQGFLARALQHEIDHLDGRLLIDHASPATTRRIKKKMNKLRP